MIPKNIVIVGGGTAGWLCALHLTKLYKDSTITLIESKRIGILGAGEGSVPIFVEFLKTVDINENEFVNRTNATYKLGVDFKEWKTPESKYIHYFNLKNSYSFHFDARLAAEFFKEKAIERGINYIDATVLDFIKNDNNDIHKIVLDTNSIIDCDFVFNCMGMGNTQLHKIYELEWSSYSDFLTVNSALPYFLPQPDTSIKYTDTKAIAMKYGWMWQIPLQNRIGCGYVFDDNYINESEAQLEIEEYLGYQITPNKFIKFKSGAYTKLWVNNVITLGLSGGFIEPLEATSIMHGITQLNLLNEYMFDNTKRNEFNIKMFEHSKEIMCFIYYHYLSNRNDTPFWKHYTYKNAPPELKKIINENDDVIAKTTSEIRKTLPHAMAYELGNWKIINAGIKMKRNIL
jgi:tryptophan halogenase